MSLKQLEMRMQVLEDIEAIKKLKADFAEACDNHYDPDKLASLFTRDAVWDEKGFMRIVGREAIKEHYRDVPKRISFAVHFYMQPRIEVRGEKASGKWYFFCLVTRANGQAVWMAGTEYDKYEKVDGEWLIADLRIPKMFFRAPFEEGWHKKGSTKPLLIERPGSVPVGKSARKFCV